MERFDTALEVLEAIMPEAKQDCFWNNWLLMKYLIEDEYLELSSYAAQKVKSRHFIETNLNIMRDLNNFLINTDGPHNKLLYQDYRFHKYLSINTIVIQDIKGRKREFNKPIITIGRNKDNDYYIDNNSVSRRSCVIVNYPNDVWIYDMGSISNIIIDDKEIVQKQFLLGKHKIRLNDYSFDLYTSEGLLI